jgi:hypothetical protein
MKKIFFFLILTGAGFAFPSCFDGENKINIRVSGEAQVDTASGSCPYLTKDNQGDMVLSWIKKTDASPAAYCYAVSKDGGKTFGKPVEIPGSEHVHPHGENMPKIIFKPDGEIIAAWAVENRNPKNPYSDIVYYSQSFDNGKTWNEPQKLVKDTAGYDQRYFDLAILQNGEAAMIWLDNRKKTEGEGSALYFAETSGNKGFENERRISEPCCPCCRTDLFIDSKKNIHILYRAIIGDTIRDMVHSVSTDKGKTFSAPERISRDNWMINGCPHTGPAMTENKEGLQFAWFTGGGNAGIYCCNSKDNGHTFSPREKVSGMASRHCQIASSARGDIAMVWNEVFLKGDSSCSRIGMEIRTANGSNPVTRFISSETGDAAFPVIKVMNKNSALVAYTETVKNRNYVEYKVVKW